MSFRGQGSNQRKGDSKTFFRRYGLRILFCRFISHCRRFTDIVFLKANDSYCQLLSRHRRKNVGPGAEPPENVWVQALSMLEEMAFFKREDTSKKGTFVLWLKRAGT